MLQLLLTLLPKLHFLSTISIYTYATNIQFVYQNQYIYGKKYSCHYKIICLIVEYLYWHTVHIGIDCISGWGCKHSKSFLTVLSLLLLKFSICDLNISEIMLNNLNVIYQDFRVQFKRFEGKMSDGEATLPQIWCLIFDFSALQYCKMWHRTLSTGVQWLWHKVWQSWSILICILVFLYTYTFIRCNLLLNCILSKVNIYTLGFDFLSLILWFQMALFLFVTLY